MALPRLARLQKRILGWLAAEAQRTKGMIPSSHEDLVRALPGDKGNISRSLQTLGAQGWSVSGRSPGGKVQHLTHRNNALCYYRLHSLHPTASESA